jgi:DNA-binding MarR family transcriptional regulator
LTSTQSENPIPSRRSHPLPAASSRARALDLLRTLVAALSRSARSVEAHTGVTNAQLFILQQLVPGPLGVNALAGRAHTQQSTVSIVVSRLVHAGFAAKLRSRADRRQVVVSITPAGRRLLRNAPLPPTARLLRAMDALRAPEAQALAAGLAALARAFGAPTHHPTLLFEPPPSRRPRRVPATPRVRTRSQSLRRTR